MTKTTGSTITLSSEDRLQELLMGSLGGDALAYHSFLSQLTAHLRGFLRKRLYHNQEDIEDVVQEILVAIHNARHTYRPEEPVTAWIHAIARYKLVDYLRARSRREALHDPLDDESVFFAESDVEPADAKRDIEKLLAHLPDRQRLPIVHVKLQGLTVAEAARQSGFSESAIKVGVYRGLKALALRIRGTTA